MAQRSVRVVLSAVVSGLVDGFKKAESAASSLESKIGRNSAAVDKLGTGALAAGAVLAAGIGVAIKAYGDFDKAMSAVRATGEDARANYAALGDAAMEAGARTKFSATEAAGGIEALLKAGVSAKDVLGGGLAGALDLAAAGQMDVADASETAATAMVQFKLEGKDVGKVADLLAAGAGKAQGEVSDMAAALKQGGLVAGQFGLSVEETTAGLAAFASAGLIGSDAGTSLKSMLLALASPSKESAKLMADLGINAYDAGGEFVGLEGLAGILQERLKGLTDQQRQQALGQIFGSDAMRAASVLYDQGAAGIDKWTAAVSEQGYATKVAAELTNNLSGDFEELGGAVETAAIKMGKSADGPLRGLVQGLTTLVRAAADAPPEIQAVGLAIGGLSAGGLLAVGGLSKAVVVVKETKDALSGLGISAKTATLAMGGIGLALTVAGMALGSWMQSQAESQSRVESLTESLRGQESAFNDATRAIMADNLVKSGAAKAAEQLGLSLSLVTDASLGSADAQAKVRTQIEAASAATIAQGKEMVAATGDVQGYAAEVMSAREAADTLRKFMSGANAETAKAVEEHRLKTEAMKADTTATDGHAASTGKSTAALAAQKEQAQAAAKAVTEHATMMLQASGSAIGMESAIAATSEALKENGRGLNITTEKGRANQSALDSLAMSTITYRDKLMAAGASQEAVAQATERGRAKWISNATAMGMSKDAANRLADELFGVRDAATEAGRKSVKVPTSAPGAVAAYDAIMAAKRAADAADGKVVNITTRYHVIGSHEIGSRAAERASGGYISGPGTGTSDSIPAMLSNGEYVVRAASVAKLGLSRLDYLNRTGSLPRFAEGGQVGPRRYFAGGGAVSWQQPPWVAASVEAPTPDAIRAALEGLPLTVDLDNGRAWFGRQMAAQRAADLIAARAR